MEGGGDDGASVSRGARGGRMQQPEPSAQVLHRQGVDETASRRGALKAALAEALERRLRTPRN